MDPKKVVEQGYDRVAEGYLASKDPADPTTLDALGKLAASIPVGGAVLDLGCGAGVPVTQWLAEHGYDVTGVDISERQLELARQRIPNAGFVQSDMASLDFPPGTFDAVVAFYSIIHVPREEHEDLLSRICEWLKPGGRFLATWPLTGWEGQEENWQGWGGTVWWSHYGRDEYLAMIPAAGFIIEWADEHHGGESWLWVMARRPA